MSTALLIADVRVILDEAAEALADAINNETSLEDERALIKVAAVKRLMESGAASSVTAAEKIVESDAGYALHRSQQREAVMRKQMAFAGWEAAKLRARLAGGDQ